MRQTVYFDAPDVIPDRYAVLDHQGIPSVAKVPRRVEHILEGAVDLFIRHADPIGILLELGQPEFADVFDGEGNNAADAAVERVYPEAEHLALFAATVGHEISTQIEVLFARNEFPLGSMLDSVASMAADRASEILESNYGEELKTRGTGDTDHVVLGYSPGYCGWHITGQKKLFEVLGPAEIGITLNDSCLMTPLKSVSGVLIAGTRDVHLFDIGFSYCAACPDKSCLVRMDRLRKAGPAHGEDAVAR
jgi:hypothetical protein